MSVVRGAFGDGREWATQVREISRSNSDEDQVAGVDMPTLIAMNGGGYVDLLKVDIERSELELFSRGFERWLPKVRNICIELHGRDCEEAFFGALATYDYELQHSGELKVCRNIRPKGSVHLSPERAD